jgi:hypothetical protein
MKMSALASAAALFAAGAAPTAVSAQVLTEFPRTADGRPDLSGVWQALNTAHWNLEPHVAGYPVIDDLGAQIATPPGAGVVEGGEIPYLPEARAERDRRFANRAVEDPETNCYMGGVPRSTYMPYPFQILQNERDVAISYQYATGFRRIFVGGEEEAPLDSWMGWSNGHWEGDAFVVEVTGLNGLTWLDRAGNYASANARVEERYTLLGPNHMQYEAMIDDPTVFSRPWTIRMPLYRIVDENYRMMEFKCEAFAEEKLYGHLRKPGTEAPQEVRQQGGFAP